MENTNETSFYGPRKCSKCGEAMKYKGLGEYVCENCLISEFDDYGKVRNYIDEHKGATALEIENATGVSQKAIRNLLREERIEVAQNSKVFIKCDRCGANILSGRYCDKCALLVKHITQEKTERRNSFVGYEGKSPMDDGEIRFHRTK